MIKRLHDHFSIDAKLLEEQEVFDAFIDVDTRLFIDPILLKETIIPELVNSYHKIEEHFRKTIKLLMNSKIIGDIAWIEAVKNIVAKETKGVSIGLGKNSNDGSGIGVKLAKKISKRAKQLVDMGIEDPEIFELIGLFVDDVGPDRLSDLITKIIRADLYNYSSRIAQKLSLNTISHQYQDTEFMMPRHPDGKKPIVLLPMSILRELPIAEDLSDIQKIIDFNKNLRQKFNDIFRKVAKEMNGFTKKEKKETAIKVLLKDPESIKEFVDVYKEYKVKPYDFANDPSVYTSWHTEGIKVVEDNPLQLTLPKDPKIEDIEELIGKIISQFRKLIERNGLNKLLFKDGLKGKKPHREDVAQLLFYAVSDAYCQANNIDINREPNPGSGALDFKFSRGYNLKHVVEIKLSKHSKLKDGYFVQLPEYLSSEKGSSGTYLAIQVSNSKNLKILKNMVKKAINPNSLPKLEIIDARIRPTASKLRIEK